MPEKIWQKTKLVPNSEALYFRSKKSIHSQSQYLCVSLSLISKQNNGFSLLLLLVVTLQTKNYLGHSGHTPQVGKS